jgi:hypothetical protein
MKRIRKFGVYQTAKVSAVIYFLLSAVFMIPIALIGTIMGGSEIPGFPFTGGILVILLPFFYGALGFIFTAIGCLTYNLVSGGIEVEFETADRETLHEQMQ